MNDVTDEMVEAGFAAWKKPRMHVNWTPTDQRIDVRNIIAAVAPLIEEQVSAENNRLREDRDSHQRGAIKAMLDLAQVSAEIEGLRSQNDILAQTTAELCDRCGWRMKFPGQPCRHCETPDLAQASADLSNLLAIIHRDGGHYQADHGTEKAVADAHLIWARLMQDAEQARATVHRHASIKQRRSRSGEVQIRERPGLKGARARNPAV